MRRINQSWRDEHATHLYPFADVATPITGLGLELPSGATVDALIHPANSLGGYYLESVEIDRDSVLFNIFDGTNTPSAIGVWSASLPDTDVIPLTDLDGLRAGVLVVSADVVRNLIDAWGDGLHSFAVGTSLFVPSTWEYAVVTIDTEEEITGIPLYSQEDLYLVAEHGVRFECQIGEDDNRLIVHVIGDPLSKRIDCDTTYVTPRFVRELVFQHGQQTVKCSPSERGDSNIVVVGHDGVDSALRIRNSPDSIRLGFMAAKQ